MVVLRRFTDRDAPDLTAYFPGEDAAGMEKRIREWNAGTHEGRYFEMLAVIAGDTVVGFMSLYQHTSEGISVGPEIFPPFRRQGFAYAGLTLALQTAAEKGYRIAVAQVRKDNPAGIALHRKAGFEIDHECVTRKGNECWFFIRSIGR